MLEKTGKPCPSIQASTYANITPSPSPAASLAMDEMPTALPSLFNATPGRAPWLRQRKADRTFIGQYIDACIQNSIRGEKWRSMSEGERCGKVKEWWATGMAERAKSKSGCLSMKYPDKFDQTDEENYLRGRFRNQLKAASSDKARAAIDYDDEEPAIRPRIGVKREGSPVESAVKRVSGRSKGARVDYKEDSDDDDTRNGDSISEPGMAGGETGEDTKEAVILEACSRGLGIELGGSRGLVTENESEAPSGGGEEEGEQVQRRRWTWIGDELKIWPPF